MPLESEVTTTGKCHSNYNANMRERLLNVCRSVEKHDKKRVCFFTLSLFIIT